MKNYILIMALVLYLLVMPFVTYLFSNLQIEVTLSYIFLLIIAILTVSIIFLYFRIKKMKNGDENSEIDDVNKVERQITEKIMSGLKDNEFKMYLQFIVDRQTKRIVSAEALSRWENKDHGILGPASYIEKMEELGIIPELDFYMFDLACRQLEKWNNSPYKDISISCNFTRITLSEDNFAQRLKDVFEKYNFDISKLAIEITEDAMEKDTEIATANVKKCKELGFRIYLDDLGNGNTSLLNLCTYPIDVVKIDRDILNKTTDKRGADLFNGIIALSHSLNIKVICEGVETQKQESFVLSTDCDFIQGWYYSTPIPLYECEEFIDKYSK